MSRVSSAGRLGLPYENRSVSCSASLSGISCGYEQPHAVRTAETQSARTRQRLPSKPRSFLRSTLSVGAAGAWGFFAGVLAASAYAGLYLGERDRETARQDVVQTHYNAGLTALNDGRYERAVAEFQYVLQLDPANALAEQGAAEARARLAFKPTPTLEAAVSLAEQLLEQAKDVLRTQRTGCPRRAR